MTLETTVKSIIFFSPYRMTCNKKILGDEPKRCSADVISSNSKQRIKDFIRLRILFELSPVSSN